MYRDTTRKEEVSRALFSQSLVVEKEKADSTVEAATAILLQWLLESR